MEADLCRTSMWYFSVEYRAAGASEDMTVCANCATTPKFLTHKKSVIKEVLFHLRNEDVAKLKLRMDQ
jgi:hypothetical protein